MKKYHQYTGLLRTPNIIMDVRDAVIARVNGHGETKLSAYYQLVNSDTAVDRIQDAVRQLIEARKNPNCYGQIGARRQSLSSAFEDSLRWSSTPMEHVKPEAMAKAVDSAITASITERNIQQMAYGENGGRW